MTVPSAAPDAGVDVVVVGGGPVGVGTALMCARRGLSTVVLERATEVYDLPRAIVMDDEVQRAVHLAGAGVGLAAVTSAVPGAEFVDADGNRIIGVEIPDDVDFPAGFHPVVRYYQPDLERMLRREALAAGVQLRLGVEVTATGQDNGAAWARLSDDTSVRGRWMVAADGAASPVRKSLGIAFEDHGFDQDWLVVDLELLDDGADLPRLVQQICDPRRPATFVPGFGRYRRWEFQLQPGESADEMSAPERVWQLLAPWIAPQQGRIVRAVVYRFHATVAATMRAGRILLAGDAAHQMPPFLGQGLCAGLRDAANISWKLQMVADGAASDTLVDTYCTERRPHAAGVVSHAVDMGRTIDRLSGRGADDASLANAYGGDRPFPHLTGGLLAGDHPFVGRQVPNPRLGSERLDRRIGPGFAVVAPNMNAFAGEGLDAWRALGAVMLETDALATAGLDGAVIVRPDRYVAAVADGAAALDDLTGALTAVFA